MFPNTPAGFGTEAVADANWCGDHRTYKSHFGGMITWGSLPLNCRGGRFKILNINFTPN